MSRARWARTAAAGLASALATALVPGLATAPAAAATEPTRVHLVVLDGPGVAGHDARRHSGVRAGLVTEQDAVLARAGVTDVLYRWTTALNGFAAALTAEQAAGLAADPGVALVEENAVRPLAGAPGPVRALPASDARRGGRGTVVGVVDSGIWPESSLFADVPGLGRAPERFHGTCQPGEDWDARTCQGKLVGARWFVAGFGEDSLRSTSTLSARDDSGHGTQVASVAAGNAGVSVSLPGQRFPDYAGVAPQARVAAYKACWTAPDPDDDGCATADLVTAVDRATRDGVDVLTLASGGPADGADAVERALLGATEAGVLVVAAAGNDGPGAWASHGTPWVTTVGATTTDQRRGRLAPVGLAGAMAASRGVGPARLVVASAARAEGATLAEARACLPGSLDASRTAGAVVVCERGDLGRVEKSEAVRRADGVGMVLLNTGRGTVESDLHAVPTVHLRAAAGRQLLAWHRQHPRARVTLEPLGVRRTPARVTPWSTGGDPTGAVVKPDLVAPGVGLLGAVPPGVRGTRWDFLTGTSAATARTAGLALRLLAREGWTPDRVRSALATTATPAGSAPPLRQGAGLPSADRAARAGLAYLVGEGDYRAWLEGDADRLNTPSVLLAGEAATARRTVTNVSGRTATFTAVTGGFAEHPVTVRPSSLTLAPGESATFTLSVEHPLAVHPIDDGWLTWVGPGSRDRIPVVLAR